MRELSWKMQIGFKPSVSCHARTEAGASRVRTDLLLAGWESLVVDIQKRLTEGREGGSGVPES